MTANILMTAEETRTGMISPLHKWWITPSSDCECCKLTWAHTTAFHNEQINPAPATDMISRLERAVASFR